MRSYQKKLSLNKTTVATLDQMQMGLLIKVMFVRMT